jgi:predicted ATPase
MFDSVIKALDIVNFRSVQRLHMSLAPLTVLVGPNGSGKSTVLRALNPGEVPSPSWQHRPAKVMVSRTLDDNQVVQSIQVPGAAPQYGAQLYTFQLLRLDLEQLRQQNQLSRSPALDVVGSNLANTFGTLTRKEQGELAKELCRLVPMFSDVDLVPQTSGFHSLRFHDRWSPGVFYDPSEVSDGTMLLLAYLLLAYQRPPVDVIAIEEPERGLHPYLVGELIGFLRRLTQGEFGGHKVQVVMATHSAELLEFVKPEEVRFLSRSGADGSVSVRQVDTASVDWAKAYREYKESLGDAWLSGGLGGVPGS